MSLIRDNVLKIGMSNGPNWIFIVINDTIAWITPPRDTFQKLFRQDLLVA